MTTASTQHIPSPAPIADYLEAALLSAADDGTISAADAHRALRQHSGAGCLRHCLPVRVFWSGRPLCAQCVAELREARRA